MTSIISSDSSDMGLIIYITQKCTRMKDFSDGGGCDGWMVVVVMMIVTNIKNQKIRTHIFRIFHILEAEF